MMIIMSMIFVLPDHVPAVWRSPEVVAVWTANLLLDSDRFYQGTRDTKNGTSIVMQWFKASY